MRARGLLLVLLALVLGLAGASAQERVIPPAMVSAPDVFVEAAEPGAVGAFQLVALQSTTIVGDSPRRPDDLLVYDRASGWTLIVRNRRNPFGAGAPLPYASFRECYQVVHLRAGLTLAPIHLDGDHRTDLIGYDPQTGDVVRLYQRRSAYDCAVED